MGRRVLLEEEEKGQVPAENGDSSPVSAVESIQCCILYGKCDRKARRERW